MIAAIYARKSTEQNGVADEQKSVARQVKHAGEYATRKGWTVDEACVFVDDGISGAEFANRPGFLRLMNAVKPRPSFQVLIMSEESRLGREAIETAYALKQLVTAGVRVFFYLEDRERTLDSPTDKIMLSLTAFADELEREKARQRTYDAMLRKARSGHVTGGRVFGYENVDVQDAEGRRMYVERRILEDEAAIVRRIFDACAAGHGLRTIAKILNAERLPAPRAQQGRPTAWAPTSVRAVLYRDLYRGVVVWNKTKKRNAWGHERRSIKASADWISVEAPHLRVVSEAQWLAAHGRLEQTRQTYLRGTHGHLWGRPIDGHESKHLLTGLSRCGLCGGTLIVRSRSHGSKRAFFYACSSFHHRGKTVCPNSLEMRLEEADQAIISALGDELLDADILAYALKQLVTAGVRVFFYLEDRERTLGSPTDKIMLSLTAFADELEREKARQRTYDAMVRKARAGQVCGGRTFGYDNIASDGGGKVRVIREDEAAVVREIFARCARGEGLRTIAHALNDVAAPCPRPQLNRPAGWCPSSVREVLHRPLYRGEIVWNRTRKRNTWGQKQQHARPDADWLHIPAPALRIVTEAAWTAAQERLSTSRAVYLRSTKGQLWGMPANGVEAKNLLTGLTQCALCGGGVYVTSRSHGRRRAFFYACTSFHRKGQTVCPNNQQVVLADADEAVLEALETDLLDPVVVAEALRQATTALIESPETTEALRDALDHRAGEIITSIERWTAAIGAGGDLPSLIGRLQACEQDRARVERERRDLDAVTQLTGRDLQRIERDLRHRVDEWRMAARRNVSQGRQVLRKLLNQTRVTMRPLEDGTCQLAGRGDYGKLFSGIVATAGTSPTGTGLSYQQIFRGQWMKDTFAA